MTTKELAKLVEEMRSAQRKYFKCNYEYDGDNKAHWLKEAKRLEKIVDEAIKEEIEPSKQKGLF